MHTIFHILCLDFFFLLFFSKSKQIKKNKWLVFEKQIVLHTICFLILFLEKKNIVCILFFLEKKNIVCLCFPLKQIKTMNQSLFKNKKKSVKPWQYTYTLLPFAHIFLNVIFLFFNKKNDVIYFFYKKTKNVIVLAFFNNKVNIILSSLMFVHSFQHLFFEYCLAGKGFVNSKKTATLNTFFAVCGWLHRRSFLKSPNRRMLLRLKGSIQVFYKRLLPL